MSNIAAFRSPLSPTERKSKRVLGVDPGLSNLGTAIVDARPGPYAAVVETLLYTENIKLGPAKNYRMFHVKLFPALESLWDNYGPIEVICAEEPTVIQENAAISGYIWYVYGMIRAWAAARGIEFKALTPTQLKDKARVLMREEQGVQPRTANPTKGEIGALLRHLGLPDLPTNHEDDAVLAVIANIGQRLP